MKKYKLPKEFAEKWVAELRTTKRIQGKTGLLAEDGYCCLGIACMTVGATPKMLKHYDETVIEKDGPLNLGRRKFFDRIPEILKGSIRQSKLVEELVLMNDSGTPFKEIADWVEQNVEFV